MKSIVSKILVLTFLFSGCVSTKKFTQYQEDVKGSLSQINQKIENIVKLQSDLQNKQIETEEKMGKNTSELNYKVSNINEQIAKLKNDINEQVTRFENDNALIKRKLQIIMASQTDEEFSDDDLEEMSLIENSEIIVNPVDYDVPRSIDNGYTYLSSFVYSTPIIMTVVNKDGSISVCSIDKNTKKTYIYEYTKEMKYIKTLTFYNELEKTGAFTKDNKGNYYIFYAKDVEEDAINDENMALVKYSSEGKISNKFLYKAQATTSRFSSVKRPFDAGSCRVEISGNMIAVYFAREMFKSPNDGLNHQASYGFILDINSFEMISKQGTGYTESSNLSMPYVSHSFNQFILPINNGFLMADHGDAYPRSFKFTKVQKSAYTSGVQAFEFKKSNTIHYNYTFAQLGGLAPANDGYIFAGTYEKNTLTENSHNDSRNLFIMKIDKTLNNCGNPIWITNYTDKDTQNAASPKITKLYGNRYLLMWEYFADGNYKTTYFTIIDKDGKTLKAITELPDIRLNYNDVLRYNAVTGNVYWAVNDGTRSIVIYSFNPDSEKLFSNSAK